MFDRRDIENYDKLRKIYYDVSPTGRDVYTICEHVDTDFK